MRRFITKSVLLLIPLIIIAFIGEILLRKIPNDYTFKKEYLDKNAKNIEILFLGSSHTYYGIDPNYISANAFNASHISQSIDYDYEIIKKYETKWERLKYIVIPIDYFTLFMRVSNGIESWRVKNYEIYYDINKSNRLSDNSELLSIKPILNLKRIYSYYLKNKGVITCTELGYGKSKNDTQDLIRTGIEAAKRHSKSDRSYLTENLIILNDLTDFAESKSIKMLFYTSPAFNTYVSNLDKRQLKVIYTSISNLVKNKANCSYHNFLNDSSFSSTDFRDADHLNDFGAKKLTEKLELLIKN